MKNTNHAEVVEKIKKLYYGANLSMSDVAKALNISIDSVVYLMRKNKLERRKFTEARKIVFRNKPFSFKVNTINSIRQKELEIAGLMLYWAEGYKSDRSSGIDFANSDPQMIKIFIDSLRLMYTLDESRFRVLLYCYSNQNTRKMIDFWSKLTAIPKKQFSSPYVRQDSRKNARIMKYGMIHVRYNDKKLLVDLMDKMRYYIGVFNNA